MADHVFVCYARDDEAFVLDLARALQSRGVKVWIDQWDIPTSADWDRAIDDAVHSCSRFLIVLSPSSFESKEVRAELRAALDENKPIIPVLYRPTRVPRQLRLLQFVDMSSRGPADDSALRDVLEAFSGVPQRPPASELEIQPDEAVAVPQPSVTSSGDVASTPAVPLILLGASGHGRALVGSAIRQLQRGRPGVTYDPVLLSSVNVPMPSGSMGVLVVAADEGPLPQTREQLMLARRDGLRSLIVFLNKVDKAADTNVLDLIEVEVRETLKTEGYSGDDVPVIRGSALLALRDASGRARGPILQLLDALDSSLRRDVTG